MGIDRIGILWNGVYLFHFYGLILVLGAFAAAYVAARLAQRRGHNPELVWDALLYVMIGGVIGARLWHVFTPPPSQGVGPEYYFNLNHWVQVTILGLSLYLPAIIATMNGGLGIPGGVIGGVLALYLYARVKKLNFAEWLDIAAPGLPLAQAIGRWGNFLNQELYGRPTTLPWGLDIDAAHRVAGYTDPALRFHPLFLYESLGSLLLFVGLLYAGRRLASWLKTGDLFWLYLMGYPTLRFLLEFLRLDSPTALGLNVNQAVMALVAMTAGVVFFWRHHQRKLRRYELKQTPAAVPEAKASVAETEPGE